MKVLRAAELPVMPWKNGGGTTTEIARSPAGTSLADFDWRVSRARVASDGPFSAFPGIDRTLLVVSGEGIRLDVAGREVVLERSSEPFAFSGDTAVSATLVGGAIEDLNVMTRRGRWRHEVERRRIAGTAALDGRGEPTIVVVVEGEVATNGVRLGAGDALVFARGERLGAVSESGANVVVIALHDTPSGG